MSREKGRSRDIFMGVVGNIYVKLCIYFQGAYYWRNFKIDKSSIPQFILRGSYRLNIMVYQKYSGHNEMLMNTTVYATLKVK